jgi:hypothetical protein
MTETGDEAAGIAEIGERLLSESAIVGFGNWVHREARSLSQGRFADLLLRAHRPTPNCIADAAVQSSSRADRAFRDPAKPNLHWCEKAQRAQEPFFAQERAFSGRGR